MFKFIKKADVALFFILLLFGLLLSTFSIFSGTSGQNVEVQVAGKVYGIYDLSKNQTVEIEENGHTNKITIKDGSVQMTYSDCKNQICVKDGSIHLTNESIVCLPNKVMVEITGGEEEYDAISN